MALEGRKIVVTGVTGQVAEPVAKLLARDNDVHGAARFTDDDARARLEAAGVTCVRVDLATGDVADLPADADYVLNFAVAKSGEWDADLDANAGGVLWLMEHHRAARAFLHCSSTAVYQPDGHRAFRETDPLGDNHRVWSFLETYSICKIAAEGAARWGAARHGLPTTIARLSVPYGDHGGWPAIHLEMMLAGAPVEVHRDAPSVYHPIHEQDIVASLPGLLAAAATPATTVNWGGSEAVSIEDWCAHLGELTGVKPRFEATDATIASVALDLARMHEVTGVTRVHWKDGMRRMVEALHPELLTA
ncbi:NAD(P)-dependent oxidoreductase [Yinghuangia sp. ASG 101]|uniref:NAD-dependent epimerase/dehydratase family protein n=1 Tax=Yinghuangia sp. ASG 101 TaxID=2896848 RepID=UPI001E58FFB5|nr:NAD(P)-dependent oxidoreductase [Yinghuangia sp. ASG 101]UGQ10339.1 NAD(P)-dependent oxidoreductase [Yinghuangia sp. ASG 101]